MLALLKTLTYPLISLVLMIIGNGLFTTFVAIRLDMAGLSSEIIGIVASAFYGGILIGSLRGPKWIQQMGHFRTLVVLCAASSALILLHALWINPIYWAVLRLLSGLATGALFVVIESWFLLLGTTSMRSQSLSLYLLFFYIALSLGQQFLNVSDPNSLIPYCLASTFSSLAILPIAIHSIDTPIQPSKKHLSLIEMFQTSPHGFSGGIISGMLLASIYGLGPVYGKELGLPLKDIATLMSVIVFGGVSLQWPLGKWADLSSRRLVLMVACLVAAAFSLLIASIDPISWSLKLLLLWLFGGFSFVIYPLSMAMTCEGVEEGQITAVTGGFVLSYGIGAIAGPLIAPLFMAWIGTSGLFYFMGLICMTMGLISKRQPRNSDIEKKDQ